VSNTREVQSKMASKIKKCFLICPLGDSKSAIRSQSDKVMHHIIEPIIVKSGYALLRADSLSETGIITTQVINHVIHDDLVIADLRDHNPNVMYELAIRHMVKKPVVLLIQKGQNIPFDIAPVRTIFYDLSDPDSIESTKSVLQKQIQHIEKPDFQADNPIVVTMDIERLRGNNEEIGRFLTSLVEQLRDFRLAILGNSSNYLPRSVLQKLTSVALKMSDEFNIMQEISNSKNRESEDVRQLSIQHLNKLGKLIVTLKETLMLAKNIGVIAANNTLTVF